MQVSRDGSNSISTISQNPNGMMESNPVYTLGQERKLRLHQPEEKLLNTAGVQLYQAITGSLTLLGQYTIYFMVDALCQLARSTSTPSTAHMTAAKHLLRYLKGSPDLVHKVGYIQIKGHYDAS